ncbi:uncharacterized protein BO88DRAFT_71261 [Aspergillus vadensis CBS 113365]|uniref:Uncharacterized protein n=1 Tax=Aspergillus vadensis (strain CBS 113365 / IMI 142717 / IBT 24658) TaxID=1448311 RepID=A0A319CHS0_ASPVC|nr:hypothetical protein BO88DRAFT_71261 [Aspergillus vadensis CBS 113365]PYH67782.1 hypothetical protein BO88DRAFT_71261 [Aspergillus vadensis CBS 113365]
MKALQSGVAQKGKVPIVSPNAAFSKPSKLQVVIFCRRLKKSPSITTSLAVILPGADDSTFREPSAPLPAPTLSPSTPPAAPSAIHSPTQNLPSALFCLFPSDTTAFPLITTIPPLHPLQPPSLFPHLLNQLS